MSELLDLGVLAKYRRRTQRARAKYGAQAWLLIYQADVKHARAQRKHPELKDMTYNEKWTQAWRLALADTELWT